MAKSKLTNSSWQLGTVHWFDEKSGEGLIKGDDGSSYYVHYSAIETKKKWKSLREKSQVEFQLIDDVTFQQVARIKEI